MSEATADEAPRARLNTVAGALIRAYRGLCEHPLETVSPPWCLSCDQIIEVLDMIRCTADSEFEASALCGHFQRELRAFRSPPRTPAHGAPWAGLRA